MHIITIYVHEENSVTHVAMGCQNWAQRFYDFLLEYDGPETLAVSITEDELPQRDEDEQLRVAIWTDRFAKHARIGACCPD